MMCWFAFTSFSRAGLAATFNSRDVAAAEQQAAAEAVYGYEAPSLVLLFDDGYQLGNGLHKRTPLEVFTIIDDITMHSTAGHAGRTRSNLESRLPVLL